MEQYLTVGLQAEGEFIERKSRFIGSVCPVITEEEAIAFVESKKTSHWQASHNCWAYIIKDTGTMRYSDDGEPQGTAGIPILEVLKKEKIFNACIVVTRYYGGIQLGAGGLVRAYSHGAKIALDAGGRVTMAACTLLALTLPYPLYNKAMFLLEPYTLTILETVYTEQVTLELQLLSKELPRFKAMVTELTGGEMSPIIKGATFSPLQM